jgi:hypothetical protein
MTPTTPSPISQAAGEHIDIVFDGPPSHESGRFIEVENSQRHSIKFGEWVHRDDGYWVLRISTAPTTESAPVAWPELTDEMARAFYSAYNIAHEHRGAYESVLAGYNAMRRVDAPASPAASVLTDEQIFEIVARELGHAFPEDLSNGFIVHSEPEDWLKVVRAALLAAPMDGDRT